MERTFLKKKQKRDVHNSIHCPMHPQKINDKDSSFLSETQTIQSLAQVRLNTSENAFSRIRQTVKTLADAFEPTRREPNLSTSNKKQLKGATEREMGIQKALLLKKALQRISVKYPMSDEKAKLLKASVNRVAAKYKQLQFHREALSESKAHLRQVSNKPTAFLERRSNELISVTDLVKAADINRSALHGYGAKVSIPLSMRFRGQGTKSELAVDYVNSTNTESSSYYARNYEPHAVSKLTRLILEHLELENKSLLMGLKYETHQLLLPMEDAAVLLEHLYGSVETAREAGCKIIGLQCNMSLALVPASSVLPAARTTTQTNSTEQTPIETPTEPKIAQKIDALGLRPSLPQLIDLMTALRSTSTNSVDPFAPLKPGGKGKPIQFEYEISRSTLSKQLSKLPKLGSSPQSSTTHLNLAKRNIEQLLKSTENRPLSAAHRTVLSSLFQELSARLELLKSPELDSAHLNAISQIVYEEISFALDAISLYSSEDYHNAQTKVYEDLIAQQLFNSDDFRVKSITITRGGMEAIDQAFRFGQRFSNATLTTLDVGDTAYFELPSLFKNRPGVQLQEISFENIQSPISSESGQVLLTLNGSTPEFENNIELWVNRINTWVDERSRENTKLPHSVLILDNTLELPNRHTGHLIQLLQNPILEGKLMVLTAKSHVKHSALGSNKIAAGNVSVIASKQIETFDDQALNLRPHAQKHDHNFQSRVGSQLLTHFLKLDNLELLRVGQVIESIQFIERYLWPQSQIQASKLGKDRGTVPFLIHVIPTDRAKQKPMANKLTVLLSSHGIARAETFGISGHHATTILQGVRICLRITPDTQSKEELTESFFGLGQTLPMKSSKKRSHMRAPTPKQDSVANLNEQLQRAHHHLALLLNALGEETSPSHQHINSFVEIMHGRLANDDLQSHIDFIERYANSIRASLLKSLSILAQTDFATDDETERQTQASQLFREGLETHHRQIFAAGSAISPSTQSHLAHRYLVDFFAQDHEGDFREVLFSPLPRQGLIFDCIRAMLPRERLDIFENHLPKQFVSTHKALASEMADELLRGTDHVQQNRSKLREETV